jgi:uncharacterized protein involved in exopolysaccharide biosynthesis
MTLRDFLNVLFKRKGALLLLFVLFAGGLSAAAWLWPPWWRATASLYLRSKRETIDQSLVDNPTINRGTSLLLPDVLSEVELVKCADVRRIVVEKLGLEKEPVEPLPGATVLEPALQRAAWEGYLYDNLLVEAATNANVINVSFTDRLPERAARIVAACADAYLEFRRSLDAPGGSKSRLEAEVNEAAERLRAAEEAIAEFDERWDLVDAPAQKTRLIELLAQTRSQIAAERAAFQRAHADWKTYSDLLAAGAPELRAVEEVRADATCENLQSQISTLVLELADLLQHNLENTTPVLQVRQKIETLRKELDARTRAILESVVFARKAEVDTLTAGLRVHEELVQSIEQELDVLRSKSIQHDRLAVDLELGRDHYKSITRRMSESRFDRILNGTGNVDVVIATHGSVPHRPFFPPPFILCLIVAVVAGLLVSFSSVLVMDVLDQSFKTPDEAERHLGAEVLATIPKRSRHQLTPLLEA